MSAAPYTFDELLAVLQTSADPEYLRPFFDGAHGNGRELFEQLLSTFQRVDEAVVRSAQSMYILPSSAQVFPPASGPQTAQYEMTFTRSGLLDRPLTIAAGQVLFAEVETDATPSGGQAFETGRQYTLLQDLTFLPGETGPKTAVAESTVAGYGFGNPALGSIDLIVQSGAGLTNSRASVTQNVSTATLALSPEPDVLSPAQVGQYVQLLAGANDGEIRRITKYLGPSATGVDGGSALMMTTFVGRSVIVPPTGAFQIGEIVTQSGTVSGNPVLIQGIVKAVTLDGVAPWYIVVEQTTANFVPTVGTFGPIVGQISGATFSVQSAVQNANLTNEARTASWRVLDWVADWGLTVENTALVRHGALGMLDALGEERGIYRASNESDDSYRKRVATIADVVSPNAIRRAGNRIWQAYGATICLREVGSSLFPGMFCEGDPLDTSSLASYAYDMDGVHFVGATTGTFLDGEVVTQTNSDGYIALGRVSTTLPAAAIGSPVPAVSSTDLDLSDVRGTFNATDPLVGSVSGATFTPSSVQAGTQTADRFKLNLDLNEFRGFFLVGVPASDFGEFGIPYDPPHPYNAFDASPALAFSDGFPVFTATLNQSTWAAVDRARAAGVGFDLYVESVGCV